MSLRDDIQLAQKEAMKAHDATKLAVLRMVWSAIRNEEIDVKKELDDSSVQTVIARQAKQLEDAKNDFARGGRQDLVDQTANEISLLKQYLPAQMSHEELQAIVSRIVADSGASGQKDIGRVMGLVMKEVTGRASGDAVRNIVSSVLGS